MEGIMRPRVRIALLVGAILLSGCAQIDYHSQTWNKHVQAVLGVIAGNDWDMEAEDAHWIELEALDAKLSSACEELSRAGYLYLERTSGHVRQQGLVGIHIAQEEGAEFEHWTDMFTVPRCERVVCETTEALFELKPEEARRNLSDVRATCRKRPAEG